jgi:hypothetical protein
LRITYLYWMKDDPGRVRTVAPEHAAYWRNLGLPGYVGGPFADRSGGLIIFDADSLERATDSSPPIPSCRRNCWRVRW